MLKLNDYKVIIDEKVFEENAKLPEAGRSGIRGLYYLARKEKDGFHIRAESAISGCHLAEQDGEMLIGFDQSRSTPEKLRDWLMNQLRRELELLSVLEVFY